MEVIRGEAKKVEKEESTGVCKSCAKDLKILRYFGDQGRTHMAICDNWECRCYRSPAFYVPARVNDANLTDKEILKEASVRKAMKNLAAERNSSSNEGFEYRAISS